MRIRGLLIFLLATPTGLHAATEFENGLVPAELVRELASGSFYRSLPDQFPLVPLPADLDLQMIGSMERFNQQQLLLRTAQTASHILPKLKTAYEAAGWLDLSTLPALLNLCHDQLGQITVSVRENSGDNRVIVKRSYWSSGIVPAEAVTCAQQQSGQQAGSAWHGYFVSQLPVLEVPPQTVDVTPPLRVFGSFSSGSSTARSSVDVDRDSLIDIAGMDAAALYAHFAAQLDAQGWTNDSADTGARSASSLWYKTVAAPEFAAADVDPVELTTVLTLQHLDGTRFRVQLKMQLILETAVAGGGFSIHDSR